MLEIAVIRPVIRWFVVYWVYELLFLVSLLLSTPAASLMATTTSPYLVCVMTPLGLEVFDCFLAFDDFGRWSLLCRRPLQAWCRFAFRHRLCFVFCFLFLFRDRCWVRYRLTSKRLYILKHRRFLLLAIICFYLKSPITIVCFTQR